MVLVVLVVLNAFYMGEAEARRRRGEAEAEARRRRRRGARRRARRRRGAGPRAAARRHPRKVVRARVSSVSRLVSLSGRFELSYVLTYLPPPNAKIKTRDGAQAEPGGARARARKCTRSLTPES